MIGICFKKGNTHGLCWKRKNNDGLYRRILMSESRKLLFEKVPSPNANLQGGDILMFPVLDDISAIVSGLKIITGLPALYCLLLLFSI